MKVFVVDVDFIDKEVSGISFADVGSDGVVDHSSRIFKTLLVLIHFTREYCYWVPFVIY